MTLHIRPVADCDADTLRALLIDAAEQLAGADSVLLEAKLRWDGHPILLADANGNPVLVSFDLQDSQSALLNGLKASDQLAAALPWVSQVYPALGEYQKYPRLVVVTSDPPPGCRAVLAAHPALTLFTCRLLSVNEDIGLLLECAAAPTPLSDVAASQPRTLSLAKAPCTRMPSNPDDLAPLSEQESAYFQQL